MRSVIRISAFFLLPLWLCAWADAADEFTIYRAKYRTAEELVTLAKNMFGRRAAISAMNEKIVINAPAPTTAAILKLFAEVDREPRRYRISLRLVTAREAQNDALGAEVRGRNVRVHVDDRQETAAGRALQTVEVLDGAEALLSIGTTELPGGFFVKPTGGAAGVVNLALHQKEARANPSLSLSTDVTMPLGQWRAVGSVNQANEGKRKEILGRSSSRSTSRKEVQVRVEAIAPSKH